MNSPIRYAALLAFLASGLACSPVSDKSNTRQKDAKDNSGQNTAGTDSGNPDGKKDGDDEVVMAVPMGIFGGKQQGAFLELSELVDKAQSQSLNIPNVPDLQALQIATKLQDGTTDTLRETRDILKAYNDDLAKLFGPQTEIGSQQILLKYGESRDVLLKAPVENGDYEFSTVTFTLGSDQAHPMFTMAAKRADGKVVVTATVDALAGKLTKGSVFGKYFPFLSATFEAYTELDFTQDLKLEYSPTKRAGVFRRKIQRVRAEGKVIHLQGAADMDFQFGTPDVLDPRFYPMNMKVGDAIFSDAFIDTGNNWEMAQNLVILGVDERKETDFSKALKARTGGYSLEQQHIIDHLLKPGAFDGCATLGAKAQAEWLVVSFGKPEPAAVTALPTDMCAATDEDIKNFITGLKDICANPLALLWNLKVNVEGEPAPKPYYFCLVHEITISSIADNLVETQNLKQRITVEPADRTPAQQAFADKLKTTDFFPLTDLKTGYLKQP